MKTEVYGVMRRMAGSMGKEVTGGGRKLLGDELYNMHKGVQKY
jgi:hypothetical protein